ncbi:MAG TPA: alpha-amylase family glycosyl hydrolase [Anaerolineaceae bacterium]|nr:alpha-amylase family glycosyl hydrolase [Anaerolineaceae bacterium]HPN51712.1 alpha-amylase family glycosyl hydrolase [Anaerolineaceae bacterium]
MATLIPQWAKTVHHDGSEQFVSKLYPALGDKITLRLRIGEGVAIRAVYLRYFPDGEQAFIPMELEQSCHPSQWWQTRLQLNEPMVHYRFLILTSEGIWWYSAAGMTVYDPLDGMDFKILTNYSAPEWVHSSLFYQIFPDRFCNGNPENDPRPGEFEYKGSRPTTYRWGENPPEGQHFSLTFYGGDLEGIEQKLDYLQRLGVDVIYLNPIFSAFSNHKYDVTDYDHVDPHLGGDQALVHLREALERRNMKYILDIVPNHCGYYHSWFQKARMDPEAEEVKFFTFQQHPDQYATWLGVWSLPKLNYQSDELRRRMIDGEDAIFKRWIKPPFSADGWRVDVANMLGRQGTIQMRAELGQEIRKAVKSTHPDAYLMGENFFDATSQLQGDQFDGMMNYLGFGMPVWHWLRGYEVGAVGMQGVIKSDQKWPTEALEGTWLQVRAAIPWTIALQQYNLLDSHDTGRIRSMLRGNDALHKLAVVLQFTYPGVPGLYYGDEIGMVDHARLASRGCMEWDEHKWNHDLFEFYQRMINLRHDWPVLQKGGFQWLLTEEDTFSYMRQDWTDCVIIVAYRGETPRAAGDLDVAQGGVANGVCFEEVFTHARLEVRNGALPLPEMPQGAAIWKKV